MSQQAALEHMESIIYDPHKLLSNEDEVEVSEGAFEDAPEETKGNALAETRAADERSRNVDEDQKL